MDPERQSEAAHNRVIHLRNRPPFIHADHAIGLDVHITSTPTLKVVGAVEIRSERIPDIQFSNDSKYAYLGEPGGGRVNIVQLETAEILGMVASSGRTTMFGPAAMLSTPQKTSG